MKKKILLVLAVVALVVFGMIFVHSNRSVKEQDIVYTSYTVKQHDTLWDIAEDVNEFDMSTDEYVSILKKINNIKNDKLLQIGQTIVIAKPST